MPKKKLDLNVLEYTNYRKLLEDYFNLKNDEMRNRFSYRSFSKKAGFGSPNYIRMIIQNKKNISEDGIHKLCEAMEFNAKERDFFENLVYFNQAKTADKKDYYFKRICSFREFVVAHTLEKDQYQYFSKWYNVAIRELVALPSFKMNLFWISKQLKPHLSISETREALELLERLKLIEKNSDGKWQACSPHIKTENEIASAYAMTFHDEMIGRAHESLNHKPKTREISSVTMSISEKQFQEIKKRIAQFRDEIQNYISETQDKPDRVCQLNYQLFHLTSPSADSSKNEEDNKGPKDDETTDKTENL